MVIKDFKLVWWATGEVEFTDYRYHPIFNDLPPILVPITDRYKTYHISTKIFKTSRAPLKMYEWRQYAKYFDKSLSNDYIPAYTHRNLPLERIKFYSNPNATSWNPTALCAADYILRDMFLPHTSNSVVLTPEEAMSVMEKKKSAGILWQKRVRDENNKTTKQIVFDTYPNLLREIWDAMGNGLTPDFMKSSYEKQEILTVEKASTPRLFIPDETMSVGVMCALSYDFNKKLYSNAVYPATPSALGWCKFNGGCIRLWNDLPSDVIIADASQKDSTQQPSQAFMDAELNRLSFKKEYDTHDNLLRLSGVYASMIYGLLVLPDGSVFKKNRGNCSGQYNTSRDNTLDVIRMLCYDMLIRGFNPLNDLRIFQFIVSGDDVIADAKKFNLDHLINTFADFGIRLKTQVCKKIDSSFCSHVWKKVTDSTGQERYLLVLPENRIRSALRWMKKKFNEKLLFERLACLSIEAYPYDSLFTNIQDALEDMRAPSCYFLPRHQLEGLWYGWESQDGSPDWASDYCSSPLA